MKKIFFVLSVFFIFVNSTAGENSSLRKKEIKFIKEMYNEERYFDCIAEAGRFQVYKNNPAIEYFKYANYYLAGQYETVITNYSEDLSSEEMRFNSLLLLSGTFLKKGMYLESYRILKKYEYSELPAKNKFTMFLRRIEPLILAGETEEIDSEISGSEIFLKDTYDFTKLREELQLYNKEGLRSPFYAAVMSAVLPGLGQCYAGYPLEGVISLLAVTATAAGGIYMKDAGRKSFSYTLFFFSGVFYGGNIYGAYNSAGAGNDEVLRNRHESITSKYVRYNPGDFIDIESVFE